MVKRTVDINKHQAWLRSSLLYKEALRYIKDVPKDIRGLSSGLFVGTSSYPNITSSTISSQKYIHPSAMVNWNYKNILIHAVTQIHGKAKSNIFHPIFQELTMSYKPVEYELELETKPKPYLLFSPYFSPIGPGAPLKEITPLENPKIPRKVDSIYNERIKAELALYELKNYDHYYLIRLLNGGILGAKKKLVPTRWAITAVDDIMSKFYISRIRDYNYINEIKLFFHSFLHNNFYIILFPGRWEFENFEAWAPSTTWGAKTGFLITKEYENLLGRSSYAMSQAGGYYASRYAVSQYLHKSKKQARVIVIREVDEGYKIPVGVWQVRESIKKAFTKKPIIFEDRSHLLIYLSQHLRLPIKEYMVRSSLLKPQRTLLDT